MLRTKTFSTSAWSCL